jgi:hypothetical protein
MAWITSKPSQDKNKFPPTFGGSYVKVVHLFCLHQERTGVTLCGQSLTSENHHYRYSHPVGNRCIQGKEKKQAEPAIEEADTRERHQWRYLRWGFRAIQAAATVYIVVQLLQLLLR